MYSANYGFGNNGAPNFNNAAPQQQQQQPGGQPAGQQQQQQQQQQQMMYNQQQQFGGMGPQGGFNPGANPQMMPGNPAAMMQNAGMPHMAANGQSESAPSITPDPSFSWLLPFLLVNQYLAGYQPQFAGGPYGQVVPSSVNPQNFAPNYMMGGMQGFPMNQAAMPQQQAQMLQRMQQQQQQQANHAALNQVATPQRPPSAAQNTPGNAIPSQQGQFSTPQPPSQTQTLATQQPPPSVSTPQTPTSANPANATNGGSATGTPLSPSTEARDKERFALLLDINHELLYESIQLQTTQQELKKEHAAEGNAGDKKSTEEETLVQQDYLQCMRRLQANLSYMAALADRKPEVKVPPCPAYLSAPSLNASIKLRTQPMAQDGTENTVDPAADREERIQSIKELYHRLQAVFPGFDPKKEPTFRMPGQPGPGGQKPGNPMGNQGSPTAQRTPQMMNMAAPTQ